MEHDRYRTGDAVRAMFSMTDTPEEYERLYLTSASFKSGVDVFVGSMIPIFLRGMSVEAHKQRHSFRELYEQISQVPEVHLNLTGVDGESLKRALGLEED